MLSGLAIAAAVLSKGPVGFFPAVTPAIAWITLRDNATPSGRQVGPPAYRPSPSLQRERGPCDIPLANVLAIQAALVCTLAVSFGLMLIPAAAREYLSGYWQQQIVSSMRGEHGRVLSIAGHFNIVLLLVRNLAIPSLIVGSLLGSFAMAIWANGRRSTPHAARCGSAC